MTTYEQLLERIISEGIAEVRETYADPKDHHKRDGAIEGFEACRGKTSSDLVLLWSEAERSAATTRGDAEAYWKARYKALQIEWCLNVLSVGLRICGQDPLLSHLPTARAAMKYAEIVGVRSHGERP